MKSKKMKLKEIAQLLDMSPSTISIVLNNRPGVSDETREIVMQFLNANGYNIKKETSMDKDIHLLKYYVSGYFDERNDGFMTSIIDAISLEARKLGCNVNITSCHEGELQKVLEMIAAKPLDGMIFLGTHLPLVYENYFKGYSAPVILVDTYMSSCNLDSVVIDNGQCIYTALQHLYEIGHRTIGFVHSCFETFNSLERYDAFFRYMKRYNISVNPDHIFPVNPQFEESYNNTVSIMQKSGTMPKAIVADSDTIAIGMIGALKREGYSIPEDISVIGIGDSIFCRLTDPPLTTVQLPSDYIGHLAVRNLYDRIMSSEDPFSRTNIYGKLICRESTAPPGKSYM